jgi:hypothetical protein
VVKVSALKIRILVTVQGSRATTGSINTAVGHNAMGNGAGVVVTTHNSVALGTDAMRNSTSSNFSVAIGSSAMHDGGVQTLSVAIGSSALYGNANAVGSNNIAIGSNSMSSTSISTASSNVMIGVGTGQLAALLSQSAAATVANPSPASGASGLANPTPDTPPVIHVNGDNPAIIHVGDMYSDLGATIIDPRQTSISGSRPL